MYFWLIFVLLIIFNIWAWTKEEKGDIHDPSGLVVILIGNFVILLSLGGSAIYYLAKWIL